MQISYQSAFTPDQIEQFRGAAIDPTKVKDLDPALVARALGHVCEEHDEAAVWDRFSRPSFAPLLPVWDFGVFTIPEPLDSAEDLKKLISGNGDGAVACRWYESRNGETVRDELLRYEVKDGVVIQDEKISALPAPESEDYIPLDAEDEFEEMV
ncbi:MAG: hypothetical protein KDK78_04425 [Chlamydiia bacterium]|nr:hypothetical protein [Chlamydiia bacterium]